MNRLDKTLLITVLLLGGILWLQHRWTIRLTEERDRFRMNSTALLSDVKRMRTDSATMALDAKALRLTIDEYEEFRAEDAETIRRLGVKIRNLEAAARHEVEVKAPIDAAVRDTLIVRDTVPLLRQKVEMVTPHIHFSGLIEENRLKGDIKIPVTLNQAVWVEYLLARYSCTCASTSANERVFLLVLKKRPMLFAIPEHLRGDGSDDRLIALCLFPGKRFQQLQRGRLFLHDGKIGQPVLHPAK